MKHIKERPKAVVEALKLATKGHSDDEGVNENAEDHN